MLEWLLVCKCVQICMHVWVYIIMHLSIIPRVYICTTKYCIFQMHAHRHACRPTGIPLLRSANSPVGDPGGGRAWPPGCWCPSSASWPHRAGWPRPWPVRRCGDGTSGAPSARQMSAWKARGLGRWWCSRCRFEAWTSSCTSAPQPGSGRPASCRCPSWLLPLGPCTPASHEKATQHHRPQKTPTDVKDASPPTFQQRKVLKTEPIYKQHRGVMNSLISNSWLGNIWRFAPTD